MAFLTALLSSYSLDPPPDRPHVTLTFAQSIDAKIGNVAGGQLLLSGPESMVMTHWCGQIVYSRPFKVCLSKPY